MIKRRANSGNSYLVKFALRDLPRLLSRRSRFEDPQSGRLRHDLLQQLNTLTPLF